MSQMYHIFKEIASLITITSLRMTVFLSGHTVQTVRFSTIKLSQQIIAGHREHRKNAPAIFMHGMFVAGIVTKRKGFSFVLTLSKKNKQKTSNPSLRASAVR